MKRLILLVALAVLVYTLTVTFSAPSISFDNINYPTIIFRYYASNNTYSSNLASLSSFQLFSNNAQVGDMIYFGYGSVSYSISPIPWHDLYFSISTPLQGTGIQLVWEYWNDSAKAWKPIPNLVDGTNKFSTSGWVRFPIPPYWYYGDSYDLLKINNYYSLWVRVRLANGTVTNGGAVNQRVLIHDYTLTIRDYPNINFSYIYRVVKQNGWNIMINPNNNTYIIFSNIKFINSTLYSSKEIIQIGTLERPMTIQADYYSKLYFGRLASNGVGIDGSEIYLYTRKTSPYLRINNFYFYGSRFTRYGGGFGSPMFPSNVSIIDSQLVSDQMFYFPAGSNGTLTRVLYSVPAYIYIYSDKIRINQLILPSNALGILSGAGSPAVISNVVFATGQYLNRYYDAWVDLIDCVISPSQILSSSPTGRDVWVRKRYSFNLKLIDKNGNPVSGATVKLYDTYGNLVFSLTTNSTGQIPTQYVMTYITWWNKSENWSIRHEMSYNPFTLVVSHPDYPPVIMKWNIEQKVDLLLPIDPLDPAELYVNTTRNIYLPKDVVIINAYVLYENARQTGLTINVTVFKPDGTKSPLIQLRDDGVFPDTVAGDGLYAGLFLDTSMTGVYLVNASAIFQSGLLRANWTFIVDNTADLVLKVNASLSSQLSKVNSTLHTRIDTVNNSLSKQVTSVNNTVKTCCNEVKDLVRAVNSSLYNKIVSINGSIYGKLVAVNQSLYTELMAVNSSIHLRLNNIRCNTTTLENLVINVNQTLYNKLDRVNTTLYGKLVQINDTLYLKVDKLELKLANTNTTLYNAIRNVNSTLYVKLLEVNQSLYLKISNIKLNISQLENTVKNVNATLHGRLTSINNTLYLKVDTVQLRLLQVNNTLYNAVIKSNGSIHLRLDTIDTKTSDILARLGEVNASIHGRIIAVGDKLYLKIDSVETQVSSQSTKLDQATQSISQASSTIQQVPSKIDRSTSTILDEIQKLRNEIAMLREQLEKMQGVTFPPWVLLLVIPALILGLGILVALRKLQAPSYVFPSETPRRFKAMRVVYGVLVIIGSYLLLLRYGKALPVPFEVILALLIIGVLTAIVTSTKHGLAVMFLLGLIYHLYQSVHVSISSPEIEMPIPFPVLSLAIVFLIFTIAYIILKKRRAQQVIMW